MDSMVMLYTLHALEDAPGLAIIADFWVVLTGGRLLSEKVAGKSVPNTEPEVIDVPIWKECKERIAVKFVDIRGYE
ncbi:hypothetical protein EYZ11_004251 [Aspergillus tanneri]|uniref:Uncharacterized protein n=1 Tax=Aspergillus tanneri TaxID=1220188 RepID=A0A4S3JNB7_9EURO|nr:hypothetical protein EYZ11_004251 [Aspergillus tanneri]